jgi:hypothetical protein
MKLKLKYSNGKIKYKIVQGGETPPILLKDLIGMPLKFQNSLF